MFTLGNKEAICNSKEKFTTVLEVSGELSIKGFGKFAPAQVTDFSAQRFVASRSGALKIEAPSAADLGIDAAAVNVPVVAHIRVNTTRHSSEWAIDFIKRGRPFIFELLINGGDANDVVAQKLIDQFTEYELKFNYSDKGLPFTWSVVAEVISLNLKDPYLSFQKYVDFLPKDMTYGVKAVTTTYVDSGAVTTAAVVAGTTIPVDDATVFLVGDTIMDDNGVVVTITDIVLLNLTVDGVVDIADATAVMLNKVPQEPLFDGKYLEENVRMSLPSTSDSYGISPDEKPMISGSYSTVTWRAVEDSTSGIDGSYVRHKSLGITRGEVGGDREALFTVYFLEGSDAMDNAQVLTEFLESLGLAVTNGVFKVKSLAGVTTAAAWLA